MFSTYIERDHVGPLKLAIEDNRGRLKLDHLLPDQDVLATRSEKVLLLEFVVDFGFPSGNDGGTQTGDGPVRGGCGVDDHDSVGTGEFRTEGGGEEMPGVGGSDNDDVGHV
jgi:hypothetical protein